MILLFCALLALTMMFSACGGDGTTTDTTPETSLETEMATEGDTLAETIPTPIVSCVFTVKDKEGNLMSGVTFALSQNGTKVAEATTNDQGQATIDAKIGTYDVIYVLLPEYFEGEVDEVVLTETTTAMALTVKDTTPNGEADRPFIIIEDTTNITLPANGTYHYVLHGGMNRYFLIENTTATMTYKDQTYLPDENGTLKVDIVTDGPRDPVTFAINNTTDAEMSLTLLIQAVLGSMERPIEITDLNTLITTSVPKEGTVYYKWVSGMDGVLMVSSANPLNNITMTNTRNSATSYFTDGSACEYLAVKADDAIVIAVGSLATDAATEIEFSLSLVAGTKEAPVVMGKDKIAFLIGAGASYAYSYTPTEGTPGSLKVTGSDVRLVVDNVETVYTPDESGVITVSLAGLDMPIIFHITNNNAEAGREVTIEIK